MKCSSHHLKCFVYLFQPGFSEYHVSSERRSSSFSSGVITGVPDVTLATTSGITTAFSTLSTNLSCANNEAVGGATATAVIEQESPDLVAIDSSSSRGAAACSSTYYSCGSGPKSSLNWAGSSSSSSKVYKQLPSASSWLHPAAVGMASTKRSTSDGFHSVYQEKIGDEQQLYSQQSVAAAASSSSRPGSRGSTPSARRHLQLLARFGLDGSSDNLQM